MGRKENLQQFLQNERAELTELCRKHDVRFSGPKVPEKIWNNHLLHIIYQLKNSKFVEKEQCDEFHEIYSYFAHGEIHPYPKTLLEHVNGMGYANYQRGFLNYLDELISTIEITIVPKKYRIFDFLKETVVSPLTLRDFLIMVLSLVFGTLIGLYVLR